MHVRPFEIALIGFFAVAALAGLIFLANVKGGKGDETQVYGAQVMIWGTFPRSEMGTILSGISEKDKGFSSVKYQQIDERSFENELLNAIAEGMSPDIVILPHTLLATYRSKLTAIPFETLPERTFRDTYIDGAGIFMRSNGTYAIPFAVDPLVLYFNRDLFANAGLAQPPKTWEMLVSESTPALTQVDSNSKITQSAIGMGEFINVKYAKEILALLMFQAGTNIVEENDENYEITLSKSVTNGVQPGESALNFYTQFSSPASRAFTWSRSRPLDKNAFTGGTLAMYLGLGSEIKSIEEENPNLSFDIAPVPQAQGATALRNYGVFYGFAIPKASKNVSGAYRAATVLGDALNASELTSLLGLTPVHRSLYGSGGDAYTPVLEQSALIARGWLDPSPEGSRDAFKKMIESITSGRTEANDAVRDAVYTLETLFR